MKNLKIYFIVITIILYSCSAYKMKLRECELNKYANNGNSLFELIIYNNTNTDYHLSTYQNIDSTEFLYFSSYLFLAKEVGYSNSVLDSNLVKNIKIQLSSKVADEDIYTKIFSIKDIKNGKIFYSLDTSIKSIYIEKEQSNQVYLNPKRNISSDIINAKNKSDSLNFRIIKSFKTNIVNTYFQRKYDYYGTLREEGKSSSINFIWNGSEVDLSEVGVWKIYKVNGDFKEFTTFF